MRAAAANDRRRRRPAPSADREGPFPEERGEILQRLWDLTSEGVFIVREGRVLESNRFLSARAGYAEAEVDGTLFSSFFSTECIPAVDALCAEAAAGGEAAVRPQAVLIAKQGERIEVRLAAASCRFRGKAAAVVVASPVSGPVAAPVWDLDPERFFASEEPAPAPPRCS